MPPFETSFELVGAVGPADGVADVQRLVQTRREPAARLKWVGDIVEIEREIDPERLVPEKRVFARNKSGPELVNHLPQKRCERSGKGAFRHHRSTRRGRPSKARS